MLNGITWSEYLTALFIAVIIYYLLIALRYYPKELKRCLSGKRKGNEEQEEDFDTESGSATKADEVHNLFSDEESTEKAFASAEELSNQIRITVMEAVDKSLSKDNLCLLLGTLLDDYPQFRDNAFQVAINNVINTELEKYGSVPLSAVELDGLWKEGS
ncbi:MULTISPECIES: hypothetical protein [Olivibacter]|uniref:Uncharacterized protein n=1 Tax=Olivibacter oleidegradans TaxID=760123 RepID=A0ABV6HKH7_9SPHI|nr:hypothetical protein [Olivibacter jilunii]